MSTAMNVSVLVVLGLIAAVGLILTAGVVASLVSQRRALRAVPV